MALPVVFAGFLALVVMASGTIDTWVLDSGSVRVEPFPGDVEPSEAVPVLKASLEDARPTASSHQLVFTRHQVERGETLSRIAFDYGLSPSTLISINRLGETNAVETGSTLIIPYRDGIRVTPGKGQDAFELAEEHGIDVSMVQALPGTADFFLTGAGEGPAIRPAGSDRFLYPVTGRVLIAYGEGMDDLTGIPYRSEGVDFAAETGQPVAASREGRVIFTGHHASYGLYVLMSHPGGWKSFYGHLSRIDVVPGDILDRGAALGTAGSSGTANSSRLHFALFRGAESVDPLDYLY